MSEPSDRAVEEMANAFFDIELKKAGVNIAGQDDDEGDFPAPQPAPPSVK